MQLSFPSVPTDSTGPVSTPLSPASASATGDSNGAAVSGGFAQVLANAAPSANANQGALPVPVGNPLAAVPTNGAPLNGLDPAPVAPAQTAPAAVVVGAAADATTLAGWMATGSAASILPTSPAPTLPSKPTRSVDQKGLAETGDIQALAVAAGLLPLPVTAPVPQKTAGVNDLAGTPVGAPGSNVLDPNAGNRSGPRAGVTALEAMMDRSAGAFVGVTVKTAAPVQPGTSVPVPAALSQMPLKATPTPAATAAVAPAAAKLGSTELKPSTPTVAVPEVVARDADQAQPQASSYPKAAAAMPGNQPAIAPLEAPVLASEKIAATPVANPGSAQLAMDGNTKSTLASDRKPVTQSAPGIGIGVAKPDATMPAGSASAHSPISDASPATVSPSLSDVRSATSSLPPAVELPSSAHRAVEAVLSATDRFTARDQHSVNLQFSVGGADLNVRVELRSGEVHTTFRTDSPELRAALSSEWNSMTSQQNGDRSARLATPVFAGSDKTETGTSFSGDGASQQRDPQSQQASTPNPGLGGSRRGPATTASSSMNSNLPMTRNVAVNSVHLHTLA